MSTVLDGAASVRRRGEVLEIDPESFSDGFSRRAMKVRHALANHPLLALDALGRLADALPLASIERARAANIPNVVPGGAQPIEGPPSDTVRGIEHNGCWMVLWYIDRVPEYRALLDACLDAAAPLLSNREGGMCRREAFLFLSAPRSVTPVHIDPEHNFLLQIRGTKEFTAVEWGDGEAERELHRFFDGGHRNLTAMPTGHANTFRIAPGEGVYNPPFVPHWVQNGQAVSVSLSITFRTRLSQRFEHVHTFNAKLRRLHVSSKPPGNSETADRAKAAAVVTWTRVRRVGRLVGLRGRGRRG